MATPGGVEDAVVGIARDDKLYVVDVETNLSIAAGAITARLPDGRVLIDGRNLPESSAWGFPAHPIATVSAIGRNVVSDPAVTDAANDAVEGASENPVVWAHGSRLTAMVERSEAEGVERALHAALIGT